MANGQTAGTGDPPALFWSYHAPERRKDPKIKCREHYFRQLNLGS